jgi:hypothetical protein
MNNFEDQLDEIRINLYEETKEMDKEEIIRAVNSHAQKIAHEFGIIISNTIETDFSNAPPPPSTGRAFSGHTA